MTLSFEAVLGTLAATTICCLIAQEIHRRGNAIGLGPLLWRGPERRRIGAWAFSVLGLLRMADFIWAWHKSGRVDYKSALLGLLFLLVARVSFLDARGLAVHEGGIDAGSLICGWDQLKKWAWADDRRAIRFWCASAWFPWPQTVPMDFDSELETILNARAPMSRTEPMSLLG